MPPVSKSLTTDKQQRLHELLVQQVTRAVPVAVRIFRIQESPLPGVGHGAVFLGGSRGLADYADTNFYNIPLARRLRQAACPPG